MFLTIYKLLFMQSYFYHSSQFTLILLKKVIKLFTKVDVLLQFTFYFCLQEKATTTQPTVCGNKNKTDFPGTLSSPYFPGN